MEKKQSFFLDHTRGPNYDILRLSFIVVCKKKENILTQKTLNSFLFLQVMKLRQMLHRLMAMAEANRAKMEDTRGLDTTRMKK